MYAFQIFFCVSPQGIDHGKSKKLSLAEIFLIFFPKSSSHYPIGEFEGRIRHGNQKIFDFPSHFLFAEFFGDFPDSFSKNFLVGDFVMA